MIHKVLIQDGGDWNLTYYHCTEWIKEAYPHYRRAGFYGSELITDNDEYDWDSDFGYNHVVFLFKDPTAAMLFKLTFGGGGRTVKV